GDAVALVDGTISGNVMLNDDKGADQFLGDGTNLTSFTYDNGAGHAVVALGGSTTVTTALGGTLTVHSNGDWSYTPPADVDNTNGDPHDDFTYTITDGDGDTSPATQPICIQDRVEPPNVTMTIAGDATGSCVQEDSKTSDDPNQVTVHANAQGDDHLTQLVITGFAQGDGADWKFDFGGMTQAGVTGVVFDAAAGTLTVTFGPGVTSFNGTFGVQPPADSDVDLGTLTATATAAAADDPRKTLDNNANLDVTVDANADQPHVADFTISDSGHDGSFSPNETGTAHVHVDFGDFMDGSETHTVTVDIGDGFTVTDAAGGTITTDKDGTEHVTFTIPNGTGSLDKDIGIQADNDVSQGDDHTFKVTATATETATGDDECDTSTADNVATDSKITNPPVADDHPTAYDNKQCVNEGASQNVVIIADVSGSMADDADGKGPGTESRLDLEKASLTALVDKYAALSGTVTITLIAFASGPIETAGSPDKDGATDLGTFTFSSTSDPGYAAAIAAINSLAIGLGPLNTETEYDDALLLAKDVL